VSAASPRGALTSPLVLTAVGPSPPPDGAGSAGAIIDGALSWEGGVLTYVGPASGLPPDAGTPIEASTAVVPGFVDAHTHLPFIGWRADEWRMRLEGSTYRDLHGRGGIPRSARMLAGATDDEVLAFSVALASEMLAHGTTTLELKTGYGLSVDGELRQARLARRLAAAIPQTSVVTLLACHAVPDDMDRRSWVGLATDRLIPEAGSEGLVDAVDIYVEDIAFDLDDLHRVAAAARRAGLPLRVHADQLGASGAAEAAVELGARTADHLNHASDAGIDALASGATVAVVLPASTFMLSASPAPVARLLDAGATVALGTDLNPGTSPVASMPEAIAFACGLYRMSPEQALVAATANAARALGLEARVGTLAVGRRADFVVLDSTDFDHVPYRPGHNPIVATYIGGSPAVER
jgi:imidazolonepropionase